MAEANEPRAVRLLGAVMAGGRGRRFGSDKALALYHGRPLIEHALTAIGGHCVEVVVCGRDYPPYPALADHPAPDMGPLGGLNAALHYAYAHGFTGVLSTGCDMPIFPDDLVERLVGDGPAIVEGQHMMGYWPAELGSRLDRHLLRQEHRSMRSWFTVAEPRVVFAPPLPNINQPDDLRRLEEEG